MNNLSRSERAAKRDQIRSGGNANTFTFANNPWDAIVRLVGIRRIRIEANIRVTRTAERIGFDLHIRQKRRLFFHFHSRSRTEVRRFSEASIPISGRRVFLRRRCRQHAASNLSFLILYLKQSRRVYIKGTYFSLLLSVAFSLRRKLNRTKQSRIVRLRTKVKYW